MVMETKTRLAKFELYFGYSFRVSLCKILEIAAKLLDRSQVHSEARIRRLSVKEMFAYFFDSEKLMISSSL